MSSMPRFFQYLAICVGIQLSNASLALALEQTQSKSKPPSVKHMLEEDRRGGLSCRADDPDRNTLGESAVRATRHISGKALQECRLTLKQFAEAASHGTQVVDVRPASEYAQTHIDGSLNLQTSEIKTKRFLGNRPVVLVGDGKADDLLLESCAELRSGGFHQIQVLNGGMLAWAVAGRPTVGRTADTFALAQLTAAQLFRLTLEPTSTVINGLAGERFGIAVPLEANPKWQESLIRAVANAANNQVSKHDQQRIVAATGGRVDASLYRQLIAAAKGVPVFVYTEGAEALRALVGTQAAMWQRQDQGPRQSACSTM